MKILFQRKSGFSFASAFRPALVRARLWLIFAAVLASGGLAPAAVLRVPQDYGTVRLAYAAAADDDLILFEAGLYLTTPGEFTPEKRVLLMPTNGTAILAANIPPPNDDFANRTALTGESVVAYASTYAATAQAGEPPHVSGKTVWWTWTAPSVCSVRFSTEGSSFLPTIAVFNNAADLGSLDPITTSNPGGAIDRPVSFPAQVFIIAVFGQSGTAGELVLRITTPSAANDLFANATPTAGPRVSDEAVNCGAGREPDESSLGGNSGRSLWWTWTAPFESEAQIALTDLDQGSPLLGVYTGTTLASLTPVAGAFSSPDGTNRVFRFHASAGMICRIVGDRDLNVAGRLWLRIRQRPALNIANFSLLGTNSLANGSLALTGNVTVANTGLADSNPLRLRLLSGVSVSTNSLPTQRDWTREPLAPPTLAPGGTNLVRLETILPGPETGSRDVFLVLEEALEDQWLIQDAKNLFTYNRTGISSYNDGINDPGPLLLSPPLLGGPYAPWVIQAAQLQAHSMLEGEQRQLYGTVWFTNVYRATTSLKVTNTLWTFANIPWAAPSFVTNSTNGLFRSGSVTQDTRVVLSAAYRFAGVTNQVFAEIIITNLPPPLLAQWPAASTLANGAFSFNLRGVPGRRHRVQATDSFTNPPALTRWQDLATNALGADGLWRFVDSSGRATNATRYYRVQELP